MTDATGKDSILLWQMLIVRKASMADGNEGGVAGRSYQTTNLLMTFRNGLIDQLLNK